MEGLEHLDKDERRGWFFLEEQWIKLDVPMFKLKTLDDEELHGYYYAHELSRVRGELNERNYRIDKIIKERGNQSLVKFIGFKKPEWLLTRNIDNLSWKKWKTTKELYLTPL